MIHNIRKFHAHSNVMESIGNIYLDVNLGESTIAISQGSPKNFFLEVDVVQCSPIQCINAARYSTTFLVKFFKTNFFPVEERRQI